MAPKASPDSGARDRTATGTAWPLSSEEEEDEDEGGSDANDADGQQKAEESAVESEVVTNPGEGLLVTIVGAKKLRNADADEGGFSDPFCICQIRKNPAAGKLQTKVIMDTLTPTWNFQGQMQYYTEGDTLSFGVYDKDVGIRKDLLGACDLKFDQYHPNGYEGSLQLGVSYGRKGVPTLQVKVEVLGPPQSATHHADLLENKNKKNRGSAATDESGQKKVQYKFSEPLETRPEYVPHKGLAVTILCATNLVNRDADVVGGLSDPWVQVEIPNRGDSFFKTPVIMNSLNPIWNYTAQLYEYMRGDYIKFVIWDADEKRMQGDMIGKAELQYEEYAHGVEGRLMLPGAIGREPGWLSVRVDILGPPEEAPKKKIEKKEFKPTQRARETKHIFLQYLRHRRGTTFRGWRLDVDRRQTNRVSYTDLMASCRCLGLSLTEARRVWQAYRPIRSGCPATPLEFSEFDPEEFTNLNAFLEVLWEELNFDLDLAWSILDPKDKGWVSFEEFSTGMERISFDGDMQLIFSGLDTGGQGRLWRHELDCLKLLPPESHAHPENSPIIQEFRIWIEDRYRGNSQALLWDLGCRQGSNNSITVRSFTERIQRLGFRGDALHTCMTLSRCSTQVCLNDLEELLGGSTGPRTSLSYAGRKWGYRPTERRKNVYDSTTEKPAWNASIYDPVPLNSRLGVRERHYFCKPFDRPIRDEMIKDLEENKGYQFKQESEKGEQLSRAELRLRAGQDVGGIRPMKQEDTNRIAKAIQAAGGQSRTASKESESGPAAQEPSAESAEASARLATKDQAASAEEEEEDDEEEEEEEEEVPAKAATPKADAKAKPKAKGKAVDSWRIRVGLLGGIGLTDEDTDENSPEPYCTCEIQGKPETQFRKYIKRETKQGKTENYKNHSEVVGIKKGGMLEFGIFEADEDENADEDEEDACLGVAKLAADSFLPNGFEGKVPLMDDEEEPMGDCYILVKVEVLGAG